MALNSRGSKMVSVVAALIGISVLAVALRIFARFKRKMRFGVDDYLCFLSLILLAGMLSQLVLWSTIGGNGYHQADLGPQTMVKFWKIFLANQFTYFAASPAIRISIICFYRRVFPIPMFQHVSLGVICLIASWGLAIFIACALQCRPLKFYWDKSIPGKCFNAQFFIIANQVFNVATDFVILALPIPIIWSLQRSWQEKLAVNAVFAVGGFVCFASIYRIVVLFRMDPADLTWTIYQATIWTHVELSVGLICSCLPVIRGLFPHFKMRPNRCRNGMGPCYINTNVSKPALRHCAMSNHKPPAPDCAALEDGLAERIPNVEGNPKLDYSPDHLELKDINLGTTSDVAQHPASAKSPG